MLRHLNMRLTTQFLKLFTRIGISFLLAFSGTSSAQQPGNIDDSDYSLGAGDTIQITVHQESDLSMQIFLNKNGQFSYPYLGIISALDKTTDQLAEEIEIGLRGNYLIEPSVSVSIVEYRNFYIGGEVRNPGGYSYRPGLTINQAIVIAGGETEWASSSRYRVQREGSNQTSQANADTPVYPGDTITVEAGLF